MLIQCRTSNPNKATGKTVLRPDDGKCLHACFYFIGEELVLCYARVPTWLPCRLQIYYNGHSGRASKLNRHHVKLREIVIIPELADGHFA